jgi:hypothetical protein
MATTIKISGLPTLTVSPTGDDVLLIVDNPVSNPVTKQINVSTFFSNVTIGKIVANGSVGTANQILLSNGTGTFWSSDLNLATANVGAGAFYANALGIYVTNASATNIVVSASANIGGYFTVNSSSASKTVNSSFSGANLNVTTTNTYITSNTTIAGTTTTVTSNASFTGQIAVTTNTFTLGTSTSGANGYTYLPNGLKLNWGWVLANSTTAGAITFTSAFTTNAYVVTATSNTAVATYQAAVISWNKTSANVVTANVTSTNVFWQAIGT